MKNLMDLASDEEKQHWKHVSENISMVIGFDSASRNCLEFMLKNGIPDVTVKCLVGETDVADLISRLMTHFLSTEDYETCTKLKSCKVMTSNCDLKNFLDNALIVTSFEENCEVCWEIFSYHEMIPFYGMVESVPQDYVKLMTILLNDAHDKKKFDRCVDFKILHDALIEDRESGDVYNA